MFRQLKIIALICSWLSFELTAGHQDVPNSKLRLTTFKADITPPLGDAVGIGFMRKVLSIEHRLYARGLVLRDDSGTYVLCAIDLCGLCNDSFDLFRNKIAKAAGTTASRVAVQSLHQHTAPVYDANARRILYRNEPLKLATGLQFVDHSADNVAKAVRDSLNSFQDVTHLGTTKVKVERVASNRRVPNSDGSLLTRSSSTQDPRLQSAPEGLIDPWLRSISFYNKDARLVQLHYYATHPQSFYGDDRITSDVPGIALLRLDRDQDSTNTVHIYFTGCGGNVAMGKYNNGTREARGPLVDRLYSAIKRATNTREQRHPISPIQWNSKAVQFPLRTDGPFLAKPQRDILSRSTSTFDQKLKAAMLLAWIKRVESKKPVEFSCLTIGQVQIVHLPGEPFVQFQLAAQQAAPGKFVAVAGYGECGMWYIGDDRIYTDRGGYEQSWAFTGPCEKLMKTTILQLLKTK